MDTATLIVHLSRRQEINEVAIEFIEMALQVQHFMYGLDVQELESNYECFVREITSAQNEPSFFFFF